MTLTDKEQWLFDSIKEGMDQPGCGWLHELSNSNWTDRQSAGVLSSLIRKGLVHSYRDEDVPDCYWVSLINEQQPNGWTSVTA